ncbi:vitamin B12 dependent-methionine synthase activation domain-containing protein [Floccifex sp.]|uniref:vitamin B12 dependent-methionine synthase activation domain-containing protein n=1 Tax=Floccifex sp. TaxID=2815810 RepID=UPI003F06026C
MKFQIQARITEIPLSQVLYYLGYKDQILDSQILNQIQNNIKIVSNIQPKLIYRLLSKEQYTSIDFPGNDLKEMINPAKFIIFFACTLGQEVEQILRKKEVCDVADALIFDACCNAAIENVCDNFEEDINHMFSNDFCSDRFSPGYGDCPLSFQNTLCDFLQISKTIGVCLTKNYILIPRKSVTGLIAISNHAYLHRHKGCEVCSLFMTCAFRKRGQTCEK